MSANTKGWSYSNLGNDQEFFEQKETDMLETGHNGGINPKGYYRDFMSMEVVMPADHPHVTMRGTEWVSFDHVVESDGSVDIVVNNRRLEKLPDGAKFPIEDGSVSR